MPASYFDVDGTLVKTNLLHPTLFYLANQASPLTSLGKIAMTAAKAPRLAIAELQDRRIFNEMLFTAYRGMSADRVRLLADEAFSKVMKRGMFPDAKNLVQRAKDLGHEVVLVSGALDVIMKPLVKYLGADLAIANHLEFKDDYATGKILRPVVAGPEKTRLIRDHAKAHGHDLGECFAYSDSYSDVPMLSVVGHPVAVNPDARLARLARVYGWPIVTLNGPRDEDRRGLSRVTRLLSDLTEIGQ